MDIWVGVDVSMETLDLGWMLNGMSPDTQSDSVLDTFAGFKVIRCGG
jgi:hypothetical protein